MVNYQTTVERIQKKDKLPSYELLKLIYDNAQDIITISSPEGRVEYISPSVHRLLGYEQDEILGTLSRESFHYEDLVEIKNSKILQHIDEDSFECRVKHKDGHFIWFETTVKLIRDAQGEIVHIIGIGRNISERKEAEKQHIKAIERSESFVKNTADAIWVINLEDIVLDVNPSFERIFGWSVKEVQGKKLPIIPDMLKESMKHVHQRIKMGETVVGFETIRQKKDGRLLDVEATLSPIRDHNGNVIGITGICRDVSARKRADKELKEKTALLDAFIENNVDAIVIYDQEGLVHRVNKTFEKVFGWSKEEILGIELRNAPYVPAKYANETHYLFEQAKLGQSIIGLETIRKNKNGEFLNVSLSVSPILDDKGIIKGWSVTLRDITEWKKTQQHLQNSEKLSVAGQLAAGIAHEIRNPMTAIKGFIQLMQLEVKDKETYFDVISSEIDRIEMILSELLILAKPQSIKYEKKDIRVLLSQVITLLDSQAIINNIQFVKEFKGAVTDIFCDENQLKQVFINFIKNSIESMPNGGNITIQVHSENQQEMLIRIIDQGSGIPKEVLSKLGEPFYTTKEKGTGLGFMVSKKIIENHDGKVKVKSELNKGAEIEIRLPIC